MYENVRWVDQVDPHYIRGHEEGKGVLWLLRLFWYVLRVVLIEHTHCAACRGGGEGDGGSWQGIAVTTSSQLARILPFILFVFPSLFR